MFFGAAPWRPCPKTPTFWMSRPSIRLEHTVLDVYYLQHILSSCCDSSLQSPKRKTPHFTRIAGFRDREPSGKLCGCKQKIGCDPERQGWSDWFNLGNFTTCSSSYLNHARWCLCLKQSKVQKTMCCRTQPVPREEALGLPTVLFPLQWPEWGSLRGQYFTFLVLLNIMLCPWKDF